MTATSWLPRRLRLATGVLAIVMVILTGFRLAFWGAFHGTDSPISAGDLVKALAIGLRFDLRLALVLVLPMLAVAGLRVLDPARTPSARRFWAGHYSVMVALITLFYLVDFAHYAYLQERVDVSALRFAWNPVISLRMVWETYPVVWGLLGLALLTACLFWLLDRLIASVYHGPAAATSTAHRVVVVAVSVVLVLCGLYGKASYYPLRWSDAFFTPHRFCSELALNPVLFFFDTMFTAESQDYDESRVERSYGRVAAFLGVPEPDSERLSLARHVRPTPMAAPRPNVVIILMESFAAHGTGVFGNPLKPSPHFDAIAHDSLLFTYFYTPRQGTARAVFAVLTGIPDTATQRTASRNPKIVTQYTILDAIEGYEKLYFLGGSVNWANIRGLLSHNIRGLRIYEEGAYQAPRVDVWGISDLHLFEEANRVLRELGTRPFIALIHCSGNHRPYTIPADSRGFEPVSVDDDRLSEYGFGSLAGLNSFRFMDHSLGWFMRAARKERYFDNTLFFIFGDNGTGSRSVHMPAAEQALHLGAFHTPLAIYGPGLLDGGRIVDTPASQIDILPTVAAMIGLSPPNTTLGRSLVDDRFDTQRYALVQTQRGTLPELGLVGPEHFLAVNADGSDARLFSLLSASPTRECGPELAATRDDMSELALGLYWTSKYLMYNNMPPQLEARGGG